MRTNLNILLKLTFILFVIIIIASCKKIDSWLDEKAKLSDARPTTLKDMRAILDYAEWMNKLSPAIGLVGTDNFYLTDTDFPRASETERNAYRWDKKIFVNVNSADWTNGFRKIASANIVLEGLSTLGRNTASPAEYDEIKGGALFFRAFTYYGLSQTFCQAYNPTTELTPGLPLKTTSNINDLPGRSSIKDTYTFMIADLEQAIMLLPKKAAYQTRPSVTASFALLSKIYLAMEDYDNARKYADLALDNYSVLLDFNNNSLVNLSTTFRFPAYPNNPEIIFWAESNNFQTISPITTGLGRVDNALFQSYPDRDLRKRFFFANTAGIVKFRGAYTGTNRNFAGIATNELYLIRAESAIRKNQPQVAYDAIHTLLAKRYETGYYIPVAGLTNDELLALIINERRKELPFTGQQRWEDLRRLNKEPRFAVTLQRELAGGTYTLAPGDKRFTYPIPDDEILLGHLEQNER